MSAKPETKKVFLVTNGEYDHSPDPSMTPRGVEQIARIGIWGIPKITNHIQMVVVLDGKRFMEIFEILEPVLNGVEVGHDLNEKDIWGSLEALPNGTLICGGEKILTALGLQNLYELGALIEISVMIRRARHVMTQSNV